MAIKNIWLTFKLSNLTKTQKAWSAGLAWALALAGRQKAEWVKLETEHKRRRRTIITDFKRRTYKAVDRVIDRYAESWRALRDSQAAEMAEWQARERSLIGRIRNIYKAVDLHARLRGETRGAVLTGAYNSLISSGARSAALKAANQRDALALQRKEERDIAKTKHAARLEKDFALDVHRDAFFAQRRSLIDRHHTEKVEIQTAWRQISEERTADWMALERRGSRRTGFSQSASQDQDTPPKNSAQSPEPRIERDQEGRRSKPRHMDLGDIIRNTRRSGQKKSNEQNNQRPQDRGRGRDD